MENIKQMGKGKYKDSRKTKPARINCNTPFEWEVGWFSFGNQSSGGASPQKEPIKRIASKISILNSKVKWWFRKTSTPYMYKEASCKLTTPFSSLAACIPRFASLLHGSIYSSGASIRETVIVSPNHPA